jgi:hypothetical protein
MCLGRAQSMTGVDHKTPSGTRRLGNNRGMKRRYLVRGVRGTVGGVLVLVIGASVGLLGWQAIIVGLALAWTVGLAGASSFYWALRRFARRRGVC